MFICFKTLLNDQVTRRRHTSDKEQVRLFNILNSSALCCDHTVSEFNQEEEIKEMREVSHLGRRNEMRMLDRLQSSTDWVLLVSLNV